MPDKTPLPTPLLRDQLCFSLYATSRAFTKAYATLLQEMEITYPQYLVLLVLWEKGSLTVQQIANELEVEGATATPLIKRMEVLDLVTRQRCTEDERRVMVNLTERGESFRGKSCSIPESLGRMAGVSEEQAKRLLSELNNIRAVIGK